MLPPERQKPFAKVILVLLAPEYWAWPLFSPGWQPSEMMCSTSFHRPARARRETRDVRSTNFSTQDPNRGAKVNDIEELGRKIGRCGYSRAKQGCQDARTGRRAFQFHAT
jgi:hypothetical protein